MRVILHSVILIGCCLFLFVPAKNSWSIEQRSIKRSLDDVLSSQEAGGGVSFKLNPSLVGRYPITLEIFFEQVRLVLVAEFANGARVRLPYQFNIGYDFDGEVYWERNTNNYALAQYDLTGDGIDEILFAVIAPDGESMSQVEVNVLQFHPPLRDDDLYRPQNWELASSLKAIGVIGTVNIEFEGPSIKIPRNHRGFYYEMSWFKGKFRDTGDY